MKEFVGVGVALITPFLEDESVDYEALKALVEFNISNGVDYLVISGTTAESATITLEEKKKIVETVKLVNNNRLPLVLGIGGNNTKSVINEINTTNLEGISALLSVCPYYTKPTQEGFYQHFKAISQVSPLPIILYNVPGRTAKNMLPETTIRLANDFKNIIAIKEACNDMAQYLDLIKNKPDNFLVISGDDDLALGVVLAGGSGVISVIGQAYPKLFSEIIKLGLSEKPKAAYQLFFKISNMISLIFAENNPAGIKAVLSSQNMCKSTVRLPLVEASQKLKTKINEAVLLLQK